MWSGVSETKAHRNTLSLHARSFPYVPLALLPIHHISLWARQLSGAEAYSQFSSPSNCTKYSNSSVKLEQGVEGWEAKIVKEAVVLVNPANLNPLNTRQFYDMVNLYLCKSCEKAKCHFESVHLVA